MGLTVAVKGRVDVEECNRVKETNKCLGGMKSVINDRALGMAAKQRIYEGVVVPTALYGAEIWNMREAVRRRLGVLEIRCLWGMLGVSRMDRVVTPRMSSRSSKALGPWGSLWPDWYGARLPCGWSGVRIPAGTRSTYNVFTCMSPTPLLGVNGR